MFFSFIKKKGYNEKEISRLYMDLGTLLIIMRLHCSLCRNSAQYGIGARTRPSLRKLKVSWQFWPSRSLQLDIEGFFRNYKENEAWAEHPVLFEGIPELLPKTFLTRVAAIFISHRNDQVLELLAKTQISNYFNEAVTTVLLKRNRSWVHDLFTW